MEDGGGRPAARSAGRLCLAVLLLRAAPLFAALDYQTFLHITYPQKIPSNFSEDSEDESSQAYIISINKTNYTVHLRQQTFLTDDFIVYTYNKGGFVEPNSPSLKGECFYQGYVEGHPKSLATFTTCSGLRGLLQFENVSYGIEILGSSSTNEHLVYQIRNENIQGPLLTEADNMLTEKVYEVGPEEVSYKLLSDTEADVTKSHRYIEMYIIVDKGLYFYLGRNQEIVTQSIAQVIGFVNSIFSSLNITVVLSSLEFWTDHNKISTSEEPDKLLRSFLLWKNSYLVLRPHDVAYLLVYREKPQYVGAAFAGKLCLRNFDAGVALYQKSITLETFSVILAQVLGLSLGMDHDDGKDCHCSAPICVMNTRAVRSNGIKPFSSCSIEDFKSFIKFKGAHCLSNRPHLKLYYKKRTPETHSVCGNGVLETGEKCDCGSEEECKQSKCCTASCTFQQGATCSNEACCYNCKFKPKNTVCRSSVDSTCDFPEYCNGTSAVCPPDVYVQNGYRCAGNTGYCYGGACQSPDLHCQEIFGKNSGNAPQACYEEINGQTDRFGHCGSDPKHGFKACSARNIRCGKLICSYPSTVPFVGMKVPVLYAPVEDTICVSLDLKQLETAFDPMLVKDGTKCGNDKVCIKQVCEKYEVLKYNCNPEKQCSGHGICSNRKICHCDPGWAPPNCKMKGNSLGGGADSRLMRAVDPQIAERAAQSSKRMWVLLSIFLFLPIALGSAVLVAKWNQISHYCRRAKESDDEDEEESRSYSASENMSISDKARSRSPSEERSISEKASI
ncbi:disintegrin and metalloproteinase domain-containing protein 32 isoform X2 [Hemicordylus capensis]|uniref:disintegrin and metalloproteinase domain-containing protein 32 isoform X2 n=1 Tax=Hemicordylus capensis TaxID=884348 RepID=UPI002304716F|nr:disintegrin and metalloproteinase domain-containing protein 32 isoform X2 [Hemicordylus capensis]